MNDDLISRQAAIDAASYECGELRGLFGRIEERLKSLPSAQPEIVRCKDCVYKRSVCVKFLRPTQDDFYCAFGKRRGGDAE